MSDWIFFGKKVPADRCICDVLVLIDDIYVREETAIYHEGIGTFVMRATEDKPCGTKDTVLYWREQEE